jgi:hypothetical protein
MTLTMFTRLSSTGLLVQSFSMVGVASGQDAEPVLVGCGRAFDKNDSGDSQGDD